MQKLKNVISSMPMLSSITLHGIALLLMLSSGYFADHKNTQPQIDVDLLDIEFTATDQDLSQIKNPSNSKPSSLAASVIKKTEPVKKVEAPKVSSEDDIALKTKDSKKEVNPSENEISQAAKEELNDLAKNAGSKSSVGSDSNGSSQAVRMSYDQYLVSYINKFKTYPRIAERLKQQGTVVSKIIITKEGKLKDVVINKSSGFSTLDQGTVNLIKSLAPFKPLPDHFKKDYEVSIPIEYILGS